MEHKGGYYSSTLAQAVVLYSDKVERYCYFGARQDERLQRADHGWQGGPVAQGWLIGKLVTLPKAKANPQPYLEYGKRFSARPVNAELVESLAFAVEGNGYAPPRGPADMEEMPGK